MGISMCLVFTVFCFFHSGLGVFAKKGPAERRNEGKGAQASDETQTCSLEGSQPEDLNSYHAMELIRLSVEKATELSMPVTICIRDRHDTLVAHVRMKNALLGSVDLACQKARSSALFPAPSSVLATFPALQLSNGIISGVPGGLPLMTATSLSVGSIGVSGAPTRDLDEEIAKVAADMIDMVLRDTCSSTEPESNQSIWIATGEVPDKLAEEPPAPLDLTYNKRNILPNATVTTEEMLVKPKLKWPAEKGSLYTIFLLDFGIERLQGQQYIHWMVANVRNGGRVKSGNEVQDYIPPFYFALTPDGSAILQTQGTPGHDIVALVYKQKTGKINMEDERQSGCDASIVNARIGDHAAIAEKYDLELVAGTFFLDTYTAATDTMLCYLSKCTGEPFPIPAPGINDGPECRGAGSFTSTTLDKSSTG